MIWSLFVAKNGLWFLALLGIRFDVLEFPQIEISIQFCLNPRVIGECFK